MNEKTKFDIDEQLLKLKALQPQPITFKGKVRKVHFFRQETAERFNRELETSSESDTMKDRHQREIRLLAIVLSDLHGSKPYFCRLRRWVWEIRLSHSRYDDLEAMQLLDAAVKRIQQSKMIELYAALLCEQIKNLFEIMKVQNEELQKVVEQKQKSWKGE